MHATVRSVIEVAGTGPEEICILDTEASPEHLTRGTARYADTMLLVAEPYFKSLETARRMASLGRDLGVDVALVANKVRDDHDLEAIRDFAGGQDMVVAGVIPFDDALPAAERAGAAPLDHAPDSAAVAAIEDLARSLTGNGRV
jgi:CO dehydrogenase maturation factor